MFNVINGDYQILEGVCSLTNKIEKFNNPIDEYYIIYQFTENDTSIKGRYEGVIKIIFLDSDLNPTSKLLIPIKEKLYINVI